VPYRLQRWQWITLIVTFPIYCLVVMFWVYGNFYLGYPPYTPALLNHSKRPIVREFLLERPTRLRIWGETSEGQVRVVINNTPKRTFVGRFDNGFLLQPGEHRVVLENLESTGFIQYSLQ
jgi:hypothetical protein